ncbi:MAG: hypothetical protein KJZ93_32185 [Caldilineaceae bacterium]|nr:hypothetical protein [Caldilineaceae bacterium]
MQQQITLADAFELFSLDAQSHPFTPAMMRFYNGRLSFFSRWCDRQGATQLRELDAPLIRRCLAHLQERNLSSAYVHSHAGAVKTSCGWMQSSWMISLDTLRSVD